MGRILLVFGMVGLLAYFSIASSRNYKIMNGERSNWIGLSERQQIWYFEDPKMPVPGRFTQYYKAKNQK